MLLGMLKKSVRSCAVGGCSKKLHIWKQTQCDMHKPLLHDHGLHKFPGQPVDKGVRQDWISNMNKEDFLLKTNSTVGFGQQDFS